MKKLCKKIGAFAIVAASALTFAFGGVSAPNAKAAESEILDVYLIAGQSNAVGLSRWSSLTCSEEKKTEYTEGYSNVLYRGHGDSINVTAYDTTVKSGLGSDKNCIGTELGIAETISANNPDKKSLVIKRAVGGSYLHDEKRVSTEAARVTAGNAGNWCPPSMRSDTPLSEYTGALYDELVELVEETVAHYQSEGYTVHLKGTFWMQGEAETDPVNVGESSVTVTAEGYAELLTALIGDLRGDLEPVFDNYAPAAPFVVGKIAPTFNGGGAGVERIRSAQDSVAANVSRVYTVETEDYIIVDPSTNLPATGCHDRYHFCGDDIISLGKDVANCFLENNTAAVEVFAGKNGRADITYAEFNGKPITVTFTPNEHFSIKKLTANGVDVTAQMVGNTYTVEATDEFVSLKVEYSEAAKYTMSLDYNRDCAYVQKSKGSYFYYAGERLTVKVSPKAGYKVKDVSFDGETLTANQDGEYEITITSGENKFSVSFDEVAVEDKKPSSGSSSSGASGSGCKSSVFYGGGAVLIGLAAALIKRKK
ncbi:MAG: hypothetical protein IJY62_00815 [Clostridia bacterium]|nr:hypothetical protein [Clostridia bacterium]